jgi:hypothetical protein
VLFWCKIYRKDLKYHLSRNDKLGKEYEMKPNPSSTRRTLLLLLPNWRQNVGRCCPKGFLSLSSFVFGPLCLRLVPRTSASFLRIQFQAHVVALSSNQTSHRALHSDVGDHSHLTVHCQHFRRCARPCYGHRVRHLEVRMFLLLV